MSLSSFTNLKSFSALQQLKKLKATALSLQLKYYLITCTVFALPLISIMCFYDSLFQNNFFLPSFFILFSFILILSVQYPSLMYSIYPSYRKTRKEIKAAEIEILILFESTDEQHQFIDELKNLAQINHHIYPIIDKLKIAFIKKDQTKLNEAFSLLFFNHSYLFEDKKDSKHPEQNLIDAFDSKKQKHVVWEQEHQDINGFEKEYSFKKHI